MQYLPSCSFLLQNMTSKQHLTYYVIRDSISGVPVQHTRFSFFALVSLKTLQNVCGQVLQWSYGEGLRNSKLLKRISRKGNLQRLSPSAPFSWAFQQARGGEES